MKLQSKIGKIEVADQKIYNFLTDFNNFKNLVPNDKIKDWQSDENTCSFNIDPVGTVAIKIIEKEPYKLVKLANQEQAAHDFSFWVQLKNMGENQTAIKLTIDVNLNPMMAMMAKKPIQNFLDTLVDQLKKVNYN